MTVTLCLVLLMLGSTPSGLSEAPLGRVWLFLPHLVSNLLGVCWQLHRGFSRSPSVGCGFPYHIWSLALWESAGNCFGGFPSAPSVGCGLPYHICSLLSGIQLATASGFPRSPSVKCGLPYHISSLTFWESAGYCIGGFREPPRSGVAFLTTSGLYCLEFYWQQLWDPNSTELNNNSTPTRSPTGSLKSNV